MKKNKKKFFLPFPNAAGSISLKNKFCQKNEKKLELRMNRSIVHGKFIKKFRIKT